MNVILNRSFRLYIEYALIALVIAVGTFGVWYYVEGLKLKRDLDNVSHWALEVDQANSSLVRSLEMTRQVSETNSEILSGLQRGLEAANANEAETNAKIHALERSNAAVRAYLDSVIPDGCVLDGTCEDKNGSRRPPTP